MELHVINHGGDTLRRRAASTAARSTNDSPKIVPTTQRTSQTYYTSFIVIHAIDIRIPHPVILSKYSSLTSPSKDTTCGDMELPNTSDAQGGGKEGAGCLGSEWNQALLGL